MHEIGYFETDLPVCHNLICNEFGASIANKSLVARCGELHSIASTLWLSKLSLPSCHVEFLMSER